VEVENLSSKLTILSSENTNIQKKSKITDISSEIMKSSELEEISTEIKTMPSEKTSLSNLLTQSSELSTYFSELKNKLSDKAALSSVIMNNLTNVEIYSELESNILLKDDSSYYFNYTKQRIIKEKILNKNNSQENIIIREENFIIQLSKYEDQYNSKIKDISSIDLGECKTN